MEEYRDFIRSMKRKWLGRTVNFQGELHKVVDVDYNGALLIDKKARFTDTTAVGSEMVELVEDGKRRWYFTFGDDPGFPYQSTYVIVIAGTEREAVELFRSRFPDRHKDCVNCAFWYSEERWCGSTNEAFYGSPAEIICEEVLQ